MALTWLPVLLTCIGGTVACMTDQRCSSINSEAMTAPVANNMTEYCRLRSRGIACYAADTIGCSNPDELLEPMYTGYYNTCSLTASDVDNCKQQIINCSNVLLEAFSYPADIGLNCSAMDSYLTCVRDIMTSCNNNVTIYDVLGSLHLNYDRYCNSENTGDKTMVCQYTILSAGCHDTLSNISIGGPAMNMGLYCSALNTYMTCVDQAFTNCDQSLSKDTFMLGMDQTYNQYCQGGGHCATAVSCLQPLTSMSITTPSTVQGGQSNILSSSIIQNCSMLDDVMRCMDTELAACNVSSSSSYKFGNISGPFSSVCQFLASDTDLRTCSQMATCMGTMSFPMDPVQTSRVLIDPQFWCSLLKSTMACANSSSQCPSDRSEITALLVEVNQVCPEAQLLVNVSNGNGHLSHNKTTECYQHLSAARCYDFLVNISDAMEAQRTDLYCSQTEAFMLCFYQAFAYCDQSLNIESFLAMSGMNQTYQQLCKGGGHCATAVSCLQPLTSMSITTTSTVQGGQSNILSSRIIQNCSMVDDVMRCMDTELAACNVSSSRSYKFGNISGPFSSVCQFLASNTNLLTCSQMATCMGTMSFPMDPVQTSRVLIDPQFWCSLLKSTMVCANTSSQCSPDRLEITALQIEVNGVCPEAPILVNGSDGNSNQSSNKTIECYGYLYMAGCHYSLTNMSNALEENNITLYCSQRDTFIECFHQAFANCDQSLNEYSFLTMTGINQTNQQLCQDVNECSGNHGCSFQCVNLKGSYMCVCDNNYVLNKDGKSCDPVTIIVAEVRFAKDVDSSVFGNRNRTQYKDLLAAIEGALTVYFRKIFGEAFVHLIVISIRSGSVVANYSTTINKKLKPNAEGDFIKAVKDLIDSNMTIDGDLTLVENVAIGGINVTNDLCETFNKIRDCGEAAVCTVEDGVPDCKKLSENHDYRLITGLSIGIPIFLVIVATIIAVLVIRNKNKNKYKEPMDNGMPIGGIYYTNKHTAAPRVSEPQKISTHL